MPKSEIAAHLTKWNKMFQLVKLLPSQTSCQGIKVDDDNEPESENAWAPPPAQSNVGNWIKQSICP